jgi:hypothetical protein
MNEEEEIVGCEYCRDKANRLIDGLGNNEHRDELLLECPQCGQYYSWYVFDPHPIDPLTADEATAKFAHAFRSGRPDGRLLGCTDGIPSALTSMPPAWRTSTAVALAQQMYDSRDFSTMPILADALQDAGCDNADVLAHCRGPGPHVRGCWVVDLVLGKE